jgi:ABC-type uncharacterized transport system substrate-binding protein
MRGRPQQFRDDGARLTVGNEAPAASDLSSEDFVSEGALMSFGLSLADAFRQAATYVHKILKGFRSG